MNPENPLISVVIPVYKVEKYLNRCIESVANQTYNNLEIFLIDDGSPDNCPKICDEWAAKDSRIKVFHLENGGVANARNTALRQASGEYIGFVDGDDYVEPDMYEQLISIALKNDYDIAMCSYQINDEDRGSAVCTEIPKDEVMKNVLLGEYEYGVLWNKLFKSSVVKGLEMPPLKCSQDLPYNYFAVKKADRFVKTELKLYHYYQNETSTVHGSFNIRALDAIKARDIMMNDVNDDLKKIAVKGFVISNFVVLTGIIRNQQCLDKFDELRHNIITYKKEILTSDIYTKKEKIKTIILMIFPRIYSKFIK